MGKAYFFNSLLDWSFKQIYGSTVVPAISLLIEVVFDDVPDDTREGHIACSQLLAEIVIEDVVFEKWTIRITL